MKKIIIPLVASALLAGCTSEDFEQQAQGGNFGGQVTLSSQPFTFEDGTKTVLTNTGSTIEFAWKNGEAIGIFPVAPTTNSQAKQVLNVSSEATSASFDGAGWALLKGNTYAAYSPYVDVLGSTPYTAVPIDMTGQTQNGNGSLTHIGDKYDYMYATASVPSNGNVNFAFNHVGSIIMLELIMPVYATWAKATLTAESNTFVTSATMDVSDGTLANKQMSNTVSLDLANVSGKFLTLYISALPTTTGSVTLKVMTSDGGAVTATLASKTLVAGHAYRWTYSWAQAPANAVAVDLGLSVKWANMNVGATSVTGYGNYYAWGEVEQQSSNTYDWSCYKWSNGGTSKSNPNLTKYCTQSGLGYNGFSDNIIALDPDDDAATANWGGDWRMPTLANLVELRNNCYWAWTDSYNGSGIKGYIVYKAKNTSDKGGRTYSATLDNYSLADNHIFLPSAGRRYSGSLYNDNIYGYYWMSSLDNSYNYYADNLYFGPEHIYEYDVESRCMGYCVRAVCQ